VSWDTLRLISLNLIGIRTPQREKVPENEEEEPQPDQPAEGDQPAENPSATSDIARYGFYEEDTFYIRKGYGKKIFTHFKNFYVHRMHYVGLEKKRPI
jgi:hypothetical protein